MARPPEDPTSPPHGRGGRMPGVPIPAAAPGRRVDVRGDRVGRMAEVSLHDLEPAHKLPSNSGLRLRRPSPIRAADTDEGAWRGSSGPRTDRGAPPGPPRRTALGAPKVAYRALGSRSGVWRGVLGALDRCCEHVGLSLVRRPFRAGSAGVEIDAHGHGVRRDGCRGLQAEATPAIAATEDSHALLGIVVVEDARRSGPPAGAGQSCL